MKIVLAGMGTLGDVLPLIALGRGLKDRGHDILLAAPRNFHQNVSDAGLDFCPIATDTSLPEHHVRFSIDALNLEIAGSFKTLLRPAKGADLIIGTTFQLAAPSVAEYRRSRYLLAITGPAFIDVIRGFRWLGEVASAFNRQRKRLGLKPVRDMSKHLLGNGPILNASSSDLFDDVKPDDVEMITTGAWALDQSRSKLSPHLVAFCESGEAPIYIGFGSMPEEEPDRVARMIDQALEESSTRAVICLGSSGFKRNDFSSRIFATPSAPHQLLFSRVIAAIHHGGAGTTASALKAGIPQGIVPTLTDQIYWGRLVAEGGVGVTFTSRSEMTGEALRNMIIELKQNATLRHNAMELSKSFRTNGIESAIQVIESS